MDVRAVESAYCQNCSRSVSGQDARKIVYSGNIPVCANCHSDLAIVYGNYCRHHHRPLIHGGCRKCDEG